MGYDLTWSDANAGKGWAAAGPNAPLSNLRDAVETTLRSCDPSKVWLLLPWYGRAFSCDGTDTPIQGNCSCSEKNFKKKSFELLDAAFSADCVGPWEAEASAAFECPNGGGVPGLPTDVRMQAWYDTPETLSVKYALRDEYGLGGLGVWTAASAGDASYARNSDMWAALPRS